jgi:O-antigen ligase
MKRPFSVWIIIGIAIAYGFYLISVFLRTGSFVLFIPMILSLASAVGLILNKSWSRYFVLCLSLLISLYWIYAVIAVFSKGFASGGSLYILLSLIPGALLIALCGGCSAIVFRYFKRIERKT